MVRHALSFRNVNDQPLNASPSIVSAYLLIQTVAFKCILPTIVHQSIIQNSLVSEDMPEEGSRDGKKTGAGAGAGTLE